MLSYSMRCVVVRGGAKLPADCRNYRDSAQPDKKRDNLTIPMQPLPQHLNPNLTSTAHLQGVQQYPAQGAGQSSSSKGSLVAVSTKHTLQPDSGTPGGGGEGGERRVKDGEQYRLQGKVRCGVREGMRE